MTDEKILVEIVAHVKGKKYVLAYQTIELLNFDRKDKVKFFDHLKILAKRIAERLGKTSMRGGDSIDDL